jgi:hypothetical protein
MAIQLLSGVGESTPAAACGGAAGARKLTLDRHHDRLSLPFSLTTRTFVNRGTTLGLM